jgi:hypothetical protein
MWFLALIFVTKTHTNQVKHLATPGPSNQLYFFGLVTFINGWSDTGEWQTFVQVQRTNNVASIQK